jgi:hypothetical protein
VCEAKLLFVVLIIRRGNNIHSTSTTILHTLVIAYSENHSQTCEYTRRHYTISSASRDIVDKKLLRNIAAKFTSANHNRHLFVAPALVNGVDVGMGVFADDCIPQYQYLCMYQGIVCSHGSHADLDAVHSNRNLEYIFYFKHQHIIYSIDSSAKTYICSMMNHSRSDNNVIIKKIVFDDLPFIFFFSSRVIKKQEQILFDYGDRYSDCPWIKL